MIETSWEEQKLLFLKCLKSWERERAKDVWLNISVIKPNAVAQNRRTRKVRQILTVKGNGTVLVMLSTWGLQSVILLMIRK